MEIKVVQEQAGAASVSVINPATQECVSKTHLAPGQAVTVTTSDNPENPPFIGEVAAAEEPSGGTPETAGEPPQAGEPGQPPEGEAGGQGGAEVPAEGGEPEQPQEPQGDQGGGEPTPEPGQ